MIDKKKFYINGEWVNPVNKLKTAFVTRNPLHFAQGGGPAGRQPHQEVDVYGLGVLLLLSEAQKTVTAVGIV